MKHQLRFSVGTTLACVLAFMAVGTGCKSTSPSPTSGDRQVDQVLHAAHRGNRYEVNRLLDKGMSVEAADSEGRTLLHVAANRGHDDLAESLIKRGANVNAQDKQGNTPLHLAAIGGHNQTVRRLIAGGARTDIRNSNGKTAGDVCDLSLKGLLQP